MAGTDNHEAEQYEARDLPFTWVYAEGLSEDAILRAIRSGRVYLSSGPELTFTARAAGGYETTLPGDSLPSAGTVFLAASIRTLGVPATLWLVADGRPVASIPLSGAAETVTFDPFELGRWCRLELRQGEKLSGDLLALTNPVYGAG